jgi:hypothetical protein
MKRYDGRLYLKETGTTSPLSSRAELTGCYAVPNDDEETRGLVPEGLVRIVAGLNRDRDGRRKSEFRGAAAGSQRSEVGTRRPRRGNLVRKQIHQLANPDREPEVHHAYQ